nr:MAG TPA: hypothetical protein [Caudoviricetes sp.]
MRLVPLFLWQKHSCLLNDSVHHYLITSDEHTAYYNLPLLLTKQNCLISAVRHD